MHIILNNKALIDLTCYLLKNCEHTLQAPFALLHHTKIAFTGFLCLVAPPQISFLGIKFYMPFICPFE